MYSGDDDFRTMIRDFASNKLLCSESNEVSTLIQALACLAVHVGLEFKELFKLESQRQEVEQEQVERHMRMSLRVHGVPAWEAGNGNHVKAT